MRVKQERVARRRSRRLVVIIGLVVCLVTMGASGAAASAKTYKVVLSNSFIGNSFRVLMEQEVLASANTAPLKGHVQVQIENSQNSVTAQIQSLNQIIQERPDALLLDGASSTALNSVAQRACDAGIKVVTFDEAVTAPCAWKVTVNSALIGKAWVNWMIKTLHGKGNIYEDLGIPGHGLSNSFDGALTAALKTHPGIKVVCTFYSQYALGPEQQGVSTCLGSHPDVQGVYALGYAAGSMRAMKAAGHAQVPTTGGAYNVATTTCIQLKSTCLLASYPAYIGALALKTAVSLLNGAKPNRNLITSFPFYQRGGAKTTVPLEVVHPDQIGVSAFPNLSGGLTIPYSPPWLKLSLATINKQKI